MVGGTSVAKQERQDHREHTASGHRHERRKRETPLQEEYRHEPDANEEKTRHRDDSGRIVNDDGWPSELPSPPPPPQPATVMIGCFESLPCSRCQLMFSIGTVASSHQDGRNRESQAAERHDIAGPRRSGQHHDGAKHREGSRRVREGQMRRGKKKIKMKENKRGRKDERRSLMMMPHRNPVIAPRTNSD